MGAPRAVRRTAIRPAAIVLVALAISVVIAAAAWTVGDMASQRYRIPWSALGGGGSRMVSGHFQVQGSLSRTPIGSGQSAAYAVQSGFWPGVLIQEEGGARVLLPVVLR